MEINAIDTMSTPFAMELSWARQRSSEELQQYIEARHSLLDDIDLDTML